MKKLSDILQEVEIVSLNGSDKVEVRSLRYDSRQVEPQDVFVAVRGTRTDGHLFIDSAIALGAAAIVCEEPPPRLDLRVTWVQTSNTAAALARMASTWYGHPSQQLLLTGITGTNGKTTIATLLYHLFREMGHSCGLFSTVETLVDGLSFTSTHTTPDPVMLNRRLAQMVEAGCSYAFMEVSSHAVHQHRTDGLQFAGGVFTNLTHEHLDYHKTFDEYLKTKKSFFDRLEKNAFALTNTDDRNGGVMIQNSPARTYSYALRRMADFRASVLEHSLEGMALKVDGEELWTRFVGQYNASNLLAVYATALLLGEEKREVLTILSDARPVAGRLETIRSRKGVLAVVDYAHTPDALQNVLQSLQDLKKKGQRILTVVGAGGDRDKSKRPVMGQIAFTFSDQVLLTSDNPRTEDPGQIMEEMAEGVDASEREKMLCIVNRREAIKAACALAQPGDIILVAGKGHETYQEINGVKHEFDDREELKKGLQGAGC